MGEFGLHVELPLNAGTWISLRVFATQKNSSPSCCCSLLLVSVIGLVVVSCPLTEDPSWNKAGSTVASEVEGGTVVRGAAPGTHEYKSRIKFNIR